MDNGFVTGSAYNRYSNLDNIEWKIIQYLINSKSKYANYLWKILKYDTEDCLVQPDLTKEEKLALVYRNNGDATQYRVFMSPFVDDAWEVQSSHLHIYVWGINPQSHLTGKVHVCFECIIHNKISNIYGDASEYNPQTNPVELDENGESVTEYKNRATEMLKDVIATLNGEMINAIGTMQFNEKLSPYDTSRATLWNGRKFFGHRIIMTTIMSGVSIDSDCGY
jgi:hypothetical protein